MTVPGPTPAMADLPASAGLVAPVIPLAELSGEHFLGWLETVREVQQTTGAGVNGQSIPRIPVGLKVGAMAARNAPERKIEYTLV